MGFPTGFAEALAGDYDFGRLSWALDGQRPWALSRALEEARRAAHNDGLDRGANTARRLSARHRALAVAELRAKVRSRYPGDWTEAVGIASFIYARIYLDRRALA